MDALEPPPLVDEPGAERSHEQQLRDLEFIVNHSPAMVFLWRAAPGWPVEFVSDNVRQLGYTPEDFYSGRIPYAEIVHPEDLQRVAQEVKLHSEQAGVSEFVQEYRLLTRSGAVRWVDDRTWIRRDAAGAVTHYQGIILDITERKEAEETLRQVSARYEAILGDIPDIVMEVNARRVYTWANSVGLEFFGDDVIGKEASDYFVGEQDTYQQVEALFSGESSCQYLESWQRRKDGAPRLLAWWCRNLKNPEGRVTGAISTARDITEALQAQHEREAMQARLAQSDRLANMGMLAAGVAHEINNPLSSVLYNLESLSEDLLEVLGSLGRWRSAKATGHAPEQASQVFEPGGAPAGPRPGEDIMARLQDARSSAQRIKKIVRGLSMFSREDHNEEGPVNLHACIDNALVVAHNEIKYRARIVKDLAPVPPVLASEGKLTQVLLNLLLNAGYAIDEGHVETNEIRLRTWCVGDRVHVEVKDTGCGIPDECRARLFEPFFSARKGAGNSSGLGLAICKSIVTRYKGTITFESEAGKGARFVVALPRLPAGWGKAALPPVAPEADSSAPTARGRILVIDDDPGVRRVAMRIMKIDHEVVAVESGQEAQRLLAMDRSFDVIFCDLMMPQMSGMEFHAWLSQHSPDLARRVVFITGGAFTPGASEYLARVGNLRVDKPFDVAVFRKLARAKVRETRA